MSEADTPEKKPGKRKLFAFLILGVTGLGMTAGATMPLIFAGPGTAEAAADAKDSPDHAPVVRLQTLAIGRIAVNLRGAESSLGRPRNLIIDTIVEYDPGMETGGPHGGGDDAKKDDGGHGKEAAPSDPMQARQPRMRDAFIEYLSQLSEQDVTGSSGLASTRAELLRRARAVAGNEAPRALLIQDFIIQ